VFVRLVSACLAVRLESGCARCDVRCVLSVDRRERCRRSVRRVLRVLLCVVVWRGDMCSGGVGLLTIAD
jgi:hypothetical protein